MKQLDFFDAQEDQERKCEEVTRHHKAERGAEVFDMFAAEDRPMGNQTGRITTSDPGGAIKRRTKMLGKQTLSGEGSGVASTNAGPAAATEVPNYTQYPTSSIYTF